MPRACMVSSAVSFPSGPWLRLQAEQGFVGAESVKQGLQQCNPPIIHFETQTHVDSENKTSDSV
jgi:hypothetical protein